MRSVVLVILSLVVVIIGFVLYIFLQSSGPAKIGQNLTATTVNAPPPIDPNAPQIQKGDKVWTKSYDSKTGALTNEFKADNYTPHQDGTIDLVEPEANFYLSSGQKLYLHGKTGMVLDPNAINGKGQTGNQAPDRGKLHDVTLKFYNKVADAEPQFVCTMNNLSFDNDTFTIFTDECDLPDENGTPHHVLGDQVPVHVVGVDYDFDGRGLTIKWNERDRRLSRLEIAHGEQLVVKHPNALNLNVPTSPATQPVSNALEDEAGPIELASTDGDDATAAIKAASPATPATQPKKKPKKTRKPTSKPAPPTSAPVIHRVKDPGIYRAVFQDNVKITQSGLTLATADHMNVDFLLNKDATTQPSTTQSASTQESAAQMPDAQIDHAPVVQPSANPSGVNPPTTRRSTAARKPARAGAPQTAQPSTQPTTQPTAPIIVKWTGKLIVAPPTPDVPPVVPGDSVLELVGASAPAILSRDGSNITCGSFRYHTLDQSVDVNNSPAFEIATIDDASNGSHIEAPSIHFDGTDNAADIKGPATAKFRVDNNSTKSTTQPAQYANVKWEENCHLIFTHGVKGDRLLDTAQLDGDVHVDHPQVKMIADVLDMTFDNLPRVTTQPTTNPDAPTTSAQLRSMDADGNVDCTLTDSSNRMQNIQTDHMVLHTQRSPQGNNVPSELIADGSVVASDDTQSLEAEHLLAHLEPVEAKISTQPSTNGHDVQLKDMHAEENVHFRAKDGAYADAEQLDIQSTQDAAGQTVQIINLTGHARSGDRNNSITGPIITYDAASKEAHVIGPGTMHTLQASTAHATTNPTSGPTTVATANPATQPAPRPMDITWQGKFDLVDNIVTITDKVKAKTVSADSTTNEAVGDKIVLTLVDVPPTTQPTTQMATQATTPHASTRPSGFARTGESNFMKDKVVDTATLTALPGQNVEVNSLLLAPAGGILRAMNLLAAIVIYDKTHEQFRVPTPGRLLVRDNRSDKPAAAPGAAPAPANNAQANGAMPAGGGMHGATAFEWKKSLVYDEKADTAVMDGDVHIVHDDPKAGPNAGQYEIYTDRVTAEIEPNSSATAKASGDSSFRVKRLHAQGKVRMTSTRVNFDAAECDYDPQTQTMTARANPHEPAHVLDAQGLSTGSFDELIYNTQTGDVKMKEFHANIRKH